MVRRTNDHCNWQSSLLPIPKVLPGPDLRSISRFAGGAGRAKGCMGKLVLTLSRHRSPRLSRGRRKMGLTVFQSLRLLRNPVVMSMRFASHPQAQLKQQPGKTSLSLPVRILKKSVTIDVTVPQQLIFHSHCHHAKNRSQAFSIKPVGE